MKNKDKKTVEREIATAAYKEVMAIIENHTKRDGEDTVPYFAPRLLGGGLRRNRGDVRGKLRRKNRIAKKY